MLHTARCIIATHSKKSTVAFNILKPSGTVQYSREKTS